MEVRQLQIFRILAEELNFTRTAELVHTVQSNVTAQIKALEEELGMPLFDRLGRRVAITDAGRRFLPFAEQALAAMEQGQRAMQAGAAPSGPLRIGAPESVLTYRLPQVLRAYRKRFPHVELIFRPYSDASLCAMLETGKFDMAIHMSDAAHGPAFKSIRLRTERVFLLSDASHPLANCRTVKPTDLAGQMLLLTEAGCSYREKLDRVLALQNIRPGNVTEFSSVEAIKQCVIAGMGLALLPAIVVSRELRQHQIKALHWAGPSLDIATQVLWHKDKWVSPAMAAFQEVMQEKLEDSESSNGCLAIEGQLVR
ncbi:LysR family transcriptional regulator [Acidicapsa acidisoli]|uniref:LysR family transcriptional regulator n=1 Tax=Acidicapsa acidisoli TaxID=1615681 RepID=UPI0021E0E03D|nr:LysR family transcriptional regulator [Acidicapsa acidisoli]